MKLKRITPLIALVIAAILCFTSCSGSNKTTVTELNNGERLDLDYIENGNTSQAEPEATERPWYAFLTDSFSFGKANKCSTKAAAQPTSTPDSVRELYEQGDAPTERPEKNAKPTDASNTEATPFIPPIETQKPGANGTNAPEPSATPAPTPVPTAEPKKNTVTIQIRCDTAVKNGMHREAKWAGIVPASGCILDTTEFEIEDGNTVLDVLKMARDKFRLHMEYSGGSGSGAYVEGINNLYEFDGGRWSGWMYCVNGWYPNYGCGAYYLKPGDKIEWNYTCDLGLDLDGSWWEGAQDWKDSHE